MVRVTNNVYLKISPLVIFALLMVAPFFMVRYHLALLTSVLCWIGLTVSWHFFSGVTKYVSLGSAAFFGVGVYITAIFCRTLAFPLILLLAGVISFLFACGVGFVTLRMKGVFFAIFTFGLAELLNNAILFWEMSVTGTRGRFITPFDVYYPILIITFAIILFTTILRKSKLGLALRMIGECEDAAIHFGVNATLYKVIGFAVSSMFIGLLGASFAPRWGYVDSGIAFNSLYSFMPAIMTLFGGTELYFGPIVGALVLSLLEEYLLTTFKDYFMIILGSIMILIILVLPEGITGKLLKKAG
ncbi:MAG: branched-chain amino acid ABC transporter permease [Candidatus Bathyarchaeia archaeon]